MFESQHSRGVGRAFLGFALSRPVRDQHGTRATLGQGRCSRQRAVGSNGSFRAAMAEAAGPGSLYGAGRPAIAFTCSSGERVPRDTALSAAERARGVRVDHLLALLRREFRVLVVEVQPIGIEVGKHLSGRRHVVISSPRQWRHGTD